MPGEQQEQGQEPARNPDILFEKVWAVAGLIAAGLLGYMAWDLLRGPQAPAEIEPASVSGD